MRNIFVEADAEDGVVRKAAVAKEAIEAVEEAVAAAGAGVVPEIPEWLKKSGQRSKTPEEKAGSQVTEVREKAAGVRAYQELRSGFPQLPDASGYLAITDLRLDMESGPAQTLSEGVFQRTVVTRPRVTVTVEFEVG